MHFENEKQGIVDVKSWLRNVICHRQTVNKCIVIQSTYHLLFSSFEKETTVSLLGIITNKYGYLNQLLNKKQKIGSSPFCFAKHHLAYLVAPTPRKRESFCHWNSFLLFKTTCMGANKVNRHQKNH